MIVVWKSFPVVDPPATADQQVLARLVPEQTHHPPEKTRKILKLFEVVHTEAGVTFRSWIGLGLTVLGVLTAACLEKAQIMRCISCYPETWLSSYTPSWIWTHLNPLSASNICFAAALLMNTAQGHLLYYSNCSQRVCRCFLCWFFWLCIIQQLLMMAIIQLR